MEILIGMAAMLFFFIWSGFVLWLGYKYSTRIRTEPQPIDDKVKQEIKLREEGFKNIMNYDVGVAMSKAVRE